jgi:hypothetical protein
VIIHIDLLLHFCFLSLSSSCAALWLSSFCAAFVGFSVFHWFKLTYLPQLMTDLMKTWTSTLQIWKYEDSSYFYLVIFVGTFMMSLYAINLGAVILFVGTFMISIWMNEYLFLVKKNILWINTSFHLKFWINLWKNVPLY